MTSFGGPTARTCDRDRPFPGGVVQTGAEALLGLSSSLKLGRAGPRLSGSFISRGHGPQAGTSGFAPLQKVFAP